MAAAHDLEMVVCMHVGSSSQMPTIAPDAPFMANLTWGANRTVGHDALLAVQRLVRPRFPNLKIALSEGKIGWIPYFLERAEQVLDKQRHWVQARRAVHGRTPTTDVDLDTIDVRGAVPRPRLRLLHRRRARDREPRQDRRGQRDVRDRLPALRLDLARLHRRRASNSIDHLPTESQYKILRGNAERLYRFTPAEPPVLAHA